MDIIFRKKIYNLIINLFLRLCYYYILYDIFFEKINIIFKKIFSGHFIT